MEEILKEIRELRTIVESQGRKLEYQQQEIEKCHKILRNVNLIELNKKAKWEVTNK